MYGRFSAMKQKLLNNFKITDFKLKAFMNNIRMFLCYIIHEMLI